MEELTTKNNRCLIVGAAPCSTDGLKKILENYSFDCVMAVDGGYQLLKEIGIEPTVIFGDFDSLGYVPAGENVQVFDTHKDFTDMDWALHQAEFLKFNDVVMYGGLSGRLDHSLGNLQLLVRSAHHGMRVWGVTEEEAVVSLVAPSPLNVLSFDEGCLGTVSIISHSDICHGVNEVGFEYGLENAECMNRMPWGISNELIQQPSRVWIEEGSCWAFFPLNVLDKAAYGYDNHKL